MGDKIKFSTGTVVDADGNLYQAGTQITATAAELNALDGITADVDELNRAADASARITTSTATALSLTVADHGEGVVLVQTNSTVANTFTLPTATGSGVKFTVINDIAQTQGSVVVAANGTTDVINGVAYMTSSTEEAAAAFLTSATSDKITFNAGTSGGLGGDVVEAWDVAANTWTVRVTATASGTLATPFSAT